METFAEGARSWASSDLGKLCHIRRAFKRAPIRVECSHGCHLLRCSVQILVGKPRHCKPSETPTNGLPKPFLHRNEGSVDATAAALSEGLKLLESLHKNASTRGARHARPDDGCPAADFFPDHARGPPPRRHRNRVAIGGRRNTPLQLSRGASPGAQTCQRPRRARGEERRPRRHAGLERLPAPGGLLRHFRHGSGDAHHQSAPVSRADHVHHQPCRGQLSDVRPDVRAFDREARADVQERKGLDRHDRPRAHAPGRHPQSAVLRGPGECAGGRLRLAGTGRAHRIFAVLHLGHHRQSEGRAVLAPLHGDPCLCGGAARCAQRFVARRDAAGGADVSCQRLGPALQLRAGRSQDGAARLPARRQEPVRAVRDGAGHCFGRRAHGMARAAAAHGPEQAQVHAP